MSACRSNNQMLLMTQSPQLVTGNQSMGRQTGSNFYAPSTFIGTNQNMSVVGATLYKSPLLIQENSEERQKSALKIKRLLKNAYANNEVASSNRLS